MTSTPHLLVTHANAPERRSWITTSPDSDFPIQNLPFGVFRTALKSPRVATIIGDTVIDLAALAERGYLADTGIHHSVLHQGSLNTLLRLGKTTCRQLRAALATLFDVRTQTLQQATHHHSYILHPVAEVELLLPLEIGNYTDFYSSREHATNVGTMFRDPTNALLPNWLHLPVGYHGRASSIVVSDTPIRRPLGQMMPEGATVPVFGPSKRLDFELEMAFVVGSDSTLGKPVPIAQAEDYIWGLVLFNDWSARDLQQWEYVPLGPFLGKNFGSSISPWVVALDALEPFRIHQPTPEKPLLPYLQPPGAGGFDICLEVLLTTEALPDVPHTVCRTNLKYMYWTMAQQLAHHTINGCNLCVGDLCASGTISGSSPDSYGSLLELCWKGTRPIAMPDGSTRTFLLDGDTVTMRGYAEAPGLPRIGFGSVRGTILAAWEWN